MLEPITIFNKTTGEGCDIEKDWDAYLKNVQPILTKYNWFISPSIDFRLRYYIDKNLNKQVDPESFLNKVFVYFFSVFDFENLDHMVGTWKAFSFLDDRLPILEECVNLLRNSTSKNSNIKNPYYIIIPTLIAQIDGLKNSIVERYKCKKMNIEVKDNNRNYPKKNISELFESIYSPEAAKPQFSFINDWLLKESITANDILFDVLFQKAQPMDKMEDLKPPFSRHKIMHGQFLEYGNMENTIRLFLLIDFLAELNYRMNKSTVC